MEEVKKATALPKNQKENLYTLWQKPAKIHSKFLKLWRKRENSFFFNGVLVIAEIFGFV